MFNEFLWTDSLCLDQNNSEEKKHQVRRMGEIYVKATKVLIWLGHEPGKEEKMKIVQDWPTIVDWDTLDESDSDEYESAIQDEEIRGLTGGEKWNRVREATEYLLLLPYWRRVWIVQEVALSREALIACGSASLSLDPFRKKIDEFRITRPEFNYQPTIWSLCALRDKKGSIPLWQLMCDFYLAESSRTVDKVYGFLGLVEETEKETSIADVIEVNYEKTVPQVFWDTMFECRAPWDRYSDVLFYMGRMLMEPEIGTLRKHIIDLGDYIESRRTSERHVMFAEIVLRVFEVARICIEENAVSVQDWRQAIDEVFSGTKLPIGDYSELRNAAAIGLILSTVSEEVEPSGISSRNQPISKSSWEWQEVQLKDEDAKSVAASDPTLHPQIGIKLTTPVPKTVSQPYLARMGERIRFYIQGSSFQLVAVLDTEHEPSKSWTILLNTTIGTRSFQIGK